MTINFRKVRIFDVKLASDETMAIKRKDATLFDSKSLEARKFQKELHAKYDKAVGNAALAAARDFAKAGGELSSIAQRESKAVFNPKRLLGYLKVCVILGVHIQVGTLFNNVLLFALRVHTAST